MEEAGAPAAVVAALRGAAEAGDWPLAGEAAWALEMMAAMSRRLTTAVGCARLRGGRRARARASRACSQAGSCRRLCLGASGRACTQPAPAPRQRCTCRAPTSRRAREAGGVEAALDLLRSARQQQPALRELPRDEDAAEAAATALHALLALLAGAFAVVVQAQQAP